MSKRGRPSLGKVTKDDCIYCDGSNFHWGKECPACDGTGKEKVRRQLQKVYNAKEGLPLNYNISK